jgi:uncharacterized protein YebE (UPF0316 family)
LLAVESVFESTLRLISAVPGRKLLAASVGFVEILIWIVVVGTVVRNLNSPLLVLAYAGGFLGSGRVCPRGGATLDPARVASRSRA